MCNIMNSSCLYVSADSGQKFEIVCTFSEMSYYFFNISMPFEEWWISKKVIIWRLYDMKKLHVDSKLTSFQATYVHKEIWHKLCGIHTGWGKMASGEY